MRFVTTLFFAATLALSSACSVFDSPNVKLATANSSISYDSETSPVTAARAPMAGHSRGDLQTLQAKQVTQPDSKNPLAKAEAQFQTTERKIIKNADLISE